jgi:hypothetical protein
MQLRKRASNLQEGNMKKLHLKLDDLLGKTFTTAENMSGEGTVHARSGHCDSVSGIPVCDCMFTVMNCIPSDDVSCTG